MQNSAAGVAAVTKVLLQLQHRTLVPSIHSEILNPKIDWDHIPFKLQRTIAEWKKPLVKEGETLREYPRRAGISSFGAGGSNAHVIIEEAPQAATRSNQLEKPYYLIAISAKTDRALKQKLLDLERWLSNQAANDVTLQAISYTLNVGRRHFANRCAFVVSSVDVLRESLISAINGNPSECYITGNYQPVTISNEMITTELQKLSQSLSLSPETYQNKLKQIAYFYVNQASIDWASVHFNESKNKITLPTYPFEKNRYWFDKAEKTKTVITTPLIDSNESTADKYLFKKELTNDQFIIRDHVASGKMLLPGTGYLEMMLEAGKLFHGATVKQIKNIIWQRPIIITDSPKTVSIEISRNGSNTTCKVYGDTPSGQELYCDGLLCFENDPIAKPRSGYSQYQKTLSECH